MSDEVRRRGLAFSTPTPVMQRAMFWSSRQSIDLISHSVKILIYPTLFIFLSRDTKVSWWSHPSPSHVYTKALTQPRIRWSLISRRNIPLLHLCETWQTGSFPRLHSFDELFKSESRDSFCLVTVKTCLWKWGVLSQTVFALFYRFTMALSKGFRMPPFNHVHVLSETVS